MSVRIDQYNVSNLVSKSIWICVRNSTSDSIIVRIFSAALLESWVLLCVVCENKESG